MFIEIRNHNCEENLFHVMKITDFNENSVSWGKFDIGMRYQDGNVNLLV